MVSSILKLGVAVSLLQGALALETEFNITTSTKTSKTTCNGTFAPLSASAFVKSMNPGWNLGNTLDATNTEGDWNNPPVTGDTFDDVKAAGFVGVRLPITWAYHFTSQSPDWTVDPVWLQRVSDVVDMVTSRGLYTIVNAHHDSWIWADITQSNANITQIEERFYRLWYQIGTKLGCKSSMVAFEPINEPPGTTAAHGAEQNRLNNIFLQAINDAGGFNAQRVVTLVGSGEDGAKTSQWFQPPNATFKNPWAIQYHYYSPYDFIFNAWGKTIWGSDADKASLEADIAAVRGNFTNVPLIIGEYQIQATITENAARWKYADFFLRTAAKYNTATVAWDNGADGLNRATHQWRDTVEMDILRNAVKGVNNSLADSTEDGAATSQQSSAFLYHKLGDNVTDTSLPFLFNGNTLTSATLVSTGKKLSSKSDYSVQGQNITFHQAFLKTVLNATTAPGTIANISLAFSHGASLLVNVLQWDVPTLGSTSSKIAATSADLAIPITWKGQGRLATVQATKSDGTYLVDDWTQYLGVLQKGRTTYSSQWDWDGQHVIIKSAAVDAVRSAGKATTFTFEFYPRVPGNVANYTITV